MSIIDFSPHLSRRRLLKQLGVAPLVFRPANAQSQEAHGSNVSPAPADGIPGFHDFRVTPRYPTRPPLEDLLRLVEPGTDEFITEKYASEIGSVLNRWSELLEAGSVSALTEFLHASFRGSSFQPSHEVRLRTDGPLDIRRRTLSSEPSLDREHFLSGLLAWLEPFSKVEHTSFEITSIHDIQETPLAARVRIRYDVVSSEQKKHRRQLVGTWMTVWECENEHLTPPQWKVTRWQAEGETVSVASSPMFVDITEQALGTTESYKSQMLFGADHWRSVLDSACGIDIYGNNGVAAGDYNNDGHDDLYVSQPAGLPNRLYRNRGDGTFEDVTEKAGVGVLDNTACALFADFRNAGLQDLLVVCGSGPLLFVNQGDGTFLSQPNAFRFSVPPQGTFTHAAVADYDLDGRLDIYFCVYSYYLGLDQYHYPVPYFDARNGPPNFLFHNAGDGTFVDRTKAAGLGVNNDRYSFACAWGPPSTERYPDLYVVNDFGRNVLYRSEGDGTFKVASEQAHVDDVGAGMSACWADTCNTARHDLYAANMWSAAGKRVSEQTQFHPEAQPETKALYQKHADGNVLYLNQGDNSYRNVSERAHVNMGRWAWCSDFWDFDNDGFSDLYVANGYITSAKTEPKAQNGLPDLGSFFWRQVVAKSPDEATSSQSYERGWNALNELVRSDYSWAGQERNVLFANNRDGTFTEVSSVAGLDFLEDGRSFALTDLDGDGRLEIILKNRNAPQLRVLKNVMKGIGDALCICLVGTRSNRDGVGTSVSIQVGQLHQKKYLQVGTGFLAQHTKQIFFGLGHEVGEIQALVEWPSGLTQTFRALPRTHRVTLTEGKNDFQSEAFAKVTSDTARKPAELSRVTQAPLDAIRTWLIDPLQAPEIDSTDSVGQKFSLGTLPIGPTLLTFCSSRARESDAVLANLHAHFTALKAAHLNVLALSFDTPSSTFLKASLSTFPLIAATEEVIGTYNVIYRYLFDRRRDMPMPCSFLLDQKRKIVCVYQGVLDVSTLMTDLRSMPRTVQDRLQKALPFPGITHNIEFTRNDFTYGIAMFQHGYFKQAEASFQQVVAAHPAYAEGFYNLGTLKLRKSDFAQARNYLQRALALKPDYPEAWNNLGMMAAQEGKTAEAIEQLNRSIQLRPNYAIAFLNLGNVYRRQGDRVHAEESLVHAQALQPDDAETNYSLGLFYAQQGNLEQAQLHLSTAVKLRPEYPEALNNLGVLYVRRQTYGEAEDLFKRCIEVMPDFPQSYMNLAKLYVLLKRQADARKTLQSLLKLHPQDAVVLQALQKLDAP